MHATGPKEPIQIKKYPNRRFYDATRSKHVTLQEVYDLIVAGSDVCVTDSRTNEDITNLILLQVMLERDQPKLDVFPSWVLHLMIRSNQQVLRWSVDRFLAPFMSLFSASQKRLDSYLRQAMGGQMVSPFDWADGMMAAIRGAPSTPDPSFKTETPDADVEPEVEAALEESKSDTLEDLRAQVAELTRRIEALGHGNRRDGI